MLGQSERGTEKNDTFQQLINYGMPLLGAGASAAVNATLGLLGPEGAVIGGMVGKGVEIALSKVGQDISERHLSIREKARVGAVLVIAAEDIRRRVESGETIRADGFFNEKQTGRSDAEEVVENVLLKAQREPEEKKIQYMGYLLSSITFDPHIDVYTAHQLVKTAEQLTYRQLCILRLSVVKDRFEMRDKANFNRLKIPTDLSSILDECKALNDKEYIYFDNAVVLTRSGVNPGSMKLGGLGRDLFNLMKLSLIPDEDIIPIATQLK